MLNLYKKYLGKQKLQICLSLNGDELAHISKEAFFHSHQCFFWETLMP